MRAKPMPNLPFSSVLKLGAALLLLLAGTLAPAAADPATTDPQIIIDKQIRAFLADDYSEAYSHAAPNVRMVFPDIDSFMGMVKGGYDPVYRPKTWDFARERTEADGTVYQEVLITDRNNANWAALYSLKQQPDGSWKITGVALRKSDAVSM
jgi:hypothetical protein